jgi:hypothetical protein
MPKVALSMLEQLTQALACILPNPVEVTTYILDLPFRFRSPLNKRVSGHFRHRLVRLEGLGELAIKSYRDARR